MAARRAPAATPAPAAARPAAHLEPGAARPAAPPAAGGTGSPGACVPATCGTHKWPCWHMPNPAASGLPNPASYTDLGNGAVLDNVTCLVWEKAPDTTQGFWQANADHCASLVTSSFAGYSDWRLPTRVEMASIVDFARDRRRHRHHRVSQGAVGLLPDRLGLVRDDHRPEQQRLLLDLRNEQRVHQQRLRQDHQQRLRPLRARQRHRRGAERLRRLRLPTNTPPPAAR